jgi:MoxR-like ATPase
MRCWHVVEVWGTAKSMGLRLNAPHRILWVSQAEEQRRLREAQAKAEEEARKKAEEEARKKAEEEAIREAEREEEEKKKGGKKKKK